MVKRGNVLIFKDVSNNVRLYKEKTSPHTMTEVSVSFENWSNNEVRGLQRRNSFVKVSLSLDSNIILISVILSDL